MEREKRLGWEHDLLVSREISAKRASPGTGSRADRRTLSTGCYTANCRAGTGRAPNDQQISLGVGVSFDGQVAGLHRDRARTSLRSAQAESDYGGPLEPTRAHHLSHAADNMRALAGHHAIVPNQWRGQRGVEGVPALGASGAQRVHEAD